MEATAPATRSLTSTWLIGAAVVVAGAVVVTAIALFAWVNSYQPMVSNGGGPIAGIRMIEDPNGPGFGQVALVRPGRFSYDYFLYNSGRWPVTIDRIEPVTAPGGPRVTARFLPWRRPFGSPYTAGPHPSARLARHDQGVQLNVEFRASCEGMPPHTYATIPALDVHYHYLRVFSRAQRIVPYNALVLACP